MRKTGFYIIKEKFFEDMDDPYLKGNKAGNRPHYYCFEDTRTGIYWMIPLSSRIDKYERIVETKEKAGKPCDIVHIVKLDDSRRSAFLIQDMFPITDEYIEREYTIAGNHLMLTSEHMVKEIEQKAKKVMGMLKRGVKFTPTQPNAIAILEKLKKMKAKQKVLLLGGTGLVGRAIKDSLSQDHQVVITAGHHEVEGGYQLQAENTDSLIEILEKEDPEIVISSMRGDFQAQYRFHEVLADWLAGRSKRLLFISTANVFDGDLSQPWTEEAQPAPESDYGRFKRDCEAMLMKKLSGRLIIFRIPSVWAPDCPRIRTLREFSASRKPLAAYPNDFVNVTLADQVGACAKYVLDHDLQGIFHIGSKDLVDYHEFQKMVCDLLEISDPVFALEDIPEKVYQAVLPARAELPDALQLTVSQVLQALKK